MSEKGSEGRKWNRLTATSALLALAHEVREVTQTGQLPQELENIAIGFVDKVATATSLGKISTGMPTGRDSGNLD